MAMNRHFGFGFPLATGQADRDEVWALDERPGVSFVRVERWRGEERLSVRATAKALRSIARDLDMPFATLERLEREVVRIHRKGTRLRGRQVPRPFRAALEQAAAASAEAGEAIAQATDPEARESFHALGLRGQDVALRYGQLVLVLRSGQPEAWTWPTSVEAEGHYQALVAELKERAERLHSERLAGCVIRPGVRTRRSALARVA